MTNEEIEMVQNAMVFYAEADGVHDEEEQKIFDSAYQKLGEGYEATLLDNELEKVDMPQ
jgi:uncharacterized membrane protein YebE (DUF533 family)